MAALGITAVLTPASAQAAYGRTLSVAVNAEFPPYEYCEDQEIIGIDIEIAKLIADELGMELEVCNMSFDSVFDAVESGKTEIAIGRIVAPEEESEHIAFSDGYMDVKYAVVVRSEDKELQEEELYGKKIGTADELHGLDLAEELSGEEAVMYEKETGAAAALLKKEVDALILDEKMARYLCEQNDRLYIMEKKSDDQNFVIAMKKDQEELLTEINDALATMTETGELDKIVEKYLGEEEQEQNTEES